MSQPPWGQGGGGNQAPWTGGQPEQADGGTGRKSEQPTDPGLGPSQRRGRGGTLVMDPLPAAPAGAEPVDPAAVPSVVSVPLAPVSVVDPLARTAPASPSGVVRGAAGTAPVGVPGSAPTRPGLGVSPTAPGEIQSSGPLAYDRRFTICVSCTAPIEVLPMGGAVACPRCNTPNAVLPRDDRADRAAATAPAIVSDAQRFEALRAQDGKPVVPPPAVLPFAQGALAGPRLDQCWQAWLQARDEMRTMPAFPVQERLYFLGMFIYGAISTTDGLERVRALLETTRDAVTEPRYRQQMHGMLSRVAARGGDVNAAEQWLALCAPHSNDLHMDTAWRMSRAYVSTQQGDWDTVLRTLGYRPEDVPISDDYDQMAAVFRSNALEHKGQLEQATMQLALAGGGEATVASIIQANQALGLLCPRSYPQMKAAAERAGANVVRTKSGTGLGFLGVGLPLLFGGSIGFVVLGEQFEGDAGMIVAGVGIAVLTLVFLGGVFGGMARAGARRVKLAQTGTRGSAQLTIVRQTGTRVNDQPLLELTMNVNLPGMEPYTAVHREVVPEIRLAQIQPGALLQVAVDAKDRRFMAILWS